MTEYAIREYASGDVPALTALWRRTFGDGERLLADFFRLLPDMGTGVVAEGGGELAGAAYALTGMELVSGAPKAPVCGYIYAVAVDERLRGRGLGGALTRAAAEKARERGAEIICTLPAERPLYGWYESLLGLRCALRRRVERIESAALEPGMELSSTEYMLWRENMLAGRRHLRLSQPSLEFERCLCRENGGGFYAAGSGIAAAYRDGDTGLIRELLCADGGRARVAASVGALLGVRDVVLYSPSAEGEEYIAADPALVPPDCVWNLSFD